MSARRSDGRTHILVRDLDAGVVADIAGVDPSFNPAGRFWNTASAYDPDISGTGR